MAVIENSTFEANTENLEAWFGATAVRDNADAHSGTWSFLITSTGSGGSATTLNNFPYYSGIIAGQDYDFSIWYKEVVATMPTAQWRISWRQDDGSLISSETISLPRSTTWTQVTDTFTAPALAARVYWDIFFSTGAAGPAIRIDDLLVEDAAAGITGAVDADLPTITAALTGTVPTSAALAGTVPAATGSFSGAATATGVLDATLPATTAALTSGDLFLTGHLVGDRNMPHGGLITDDGGTYRLKQTARISVSAVELVFGNWTCTVDGVGDSDGPNAYTIESCYIEHNSILTAVDFNGSGSVSIDPGDNARGIAIITITAGDTYYIRSYITPDTVGGSYPRLKVFAVDFPGEMHRKNADHANEVGTTNLTQFGDLFGPCAVTGTPTSGERRAVAIVGDSIAAGVGDTATATANVGFLYRALVGHRAFLLYALSGEAAYRFLDTQGTQREQFLGPAAQYLICQHGINDLQGSRALAQIKSALIEIWTETKTRNPIIRCYQTTITPKSASTDSWATVENQTPDGTVHATRPTLNTWIRAGAPMVDGVGVAPGTPGEIIAGQDGHPLWGFFEIADLVESTRDSGLWKAGHTADGTHPTETGHIAMAGGVDLQLLGGSTLIGQLPVPGMVAEATTIADGGVAAELPAAVSAVTAVVNATGTVDTVSPSATSSIDATVRLNGVLAGALPAPASDVTCVVTDTGSVNASLSPLVATSSATLVVLGALAGDLQLATVTLTATLTEDTTGTLTGALPHPSSVLTGILSAEGPLSATLPSPVFTLSDIALAQLPVIVVNVAIRDTETINVVYLGGALVT